MVKNFLKIGIYMVALAMLPMGMTSCSDDDDDEVVENSSDDETTEEEEEEEEEEETTDTYTLRTQALLEVIDVYINDVVYPTYTNLANYTTVLYENLVTMQENLAAGTLTQDDIDTACENFLEARAYWEKSEAWLYGPADVLGIDPHIDTWPLDRDELADLLATDALRANLEGDIEDAIVYISEENGEVSHLGFHGVEFILFRNGENRTVEDFEGYETDDAFDANTVTGAYELSFAVAVAGDLRDWTSLLEYSWMGSAASSDHIARCTTRGFQVLLDGYDNYYGEEMLLTGSSEYFQTPRYTVSAILIDGCSNICAEVADQKMGQPYRAAAGTATSEETSDEEYVGKEYIESPYSHKSFTDFYDNITSIKNALYGNIDEDTAESNSIMAYLESENSSLATELQDALDAALDALDDCVNYSLAFVTIINSNDSTGMSLVQAAMDAVTTLDETLSEANNWITVN